MTGKVYAAALGVILAVAAALRLHDIGRAPLWMDEAFTYLVAKQPLAVIIGHEVDNHPPLFYAIEHAWLAFSADPLLMRVPAALLGLATVLVVGLAGADLWSRRAGLFAAALLAVSTLHIYLSQDARMYTLAGLGIALAMWGLIGWSTRPGKGIRYGAVYVAGATIAIYAHAIGLMALTVMNAALLAQLTLDRTLRARLAGWLGANLLVMALATPWLVVLGTAATSFPGLKVYDTSLLPWFYRNAVGVPGLPDGWRQVADVLLLVTIGAGLLAALRLRRHGVLFVVGGLAIGFPVLLTLLNLKIPIFANRVFIPCTIASAMLIGIAADSARRTWLAWSAAGLLVASNLTSALIEAHTRVKNEDVPHALAIAARYGFDTAPILSEGLTFATVHIEAPTRRAYMLAGHRVLLVDDRVERLFGLPLAEVRKMSPDAMNLAMGDVTSGDATAELRSFDKIVLITTAAPTDRAQALLRAAGFARIAAPELHQRQPVILESMWTRLELWRRLPVGRGRT